MARTSGLTSAERKMRGDQAFKKGLKRLDRRALKQQVNLLELSIAPAIGFVNQVEAATRVKARAALHSRYERLLVSAGRNAVQAARLSVRTLPHITRALSRAGLDTVVEEHMPHVWRQMGKSAHFRTQFRNLQRLGLTEESIACGRAALARSGYNPLRFGGGDGTLHGLIAAGREGTKHLYRFVKVVKTRGLPTIRGASSTTVTVVFVVVAVLVTGAIIASWFY